MLCCSRFELILGGAALLVLVVSVFCLPGMIIVGPSSNLYPIGSLRPLSSQYPGGKVFVRNPELASEFAILQASGVFEIVSEDQADKVVELHQCEEAGVCGMPLLGTFVTGGLMPTSVSDSWVFSFTVEKDGKLSEQQFTLQGERRVSHLQHFLRPFRSDTRTWGSILASEFERGRSAAAGR